MRLARTECVSLLLLFSLLPVPRALAQGTALEGSAGDAPASVRTRTRSGLLPGEAVIVEIRARGSVIPLEASALGRRIALWRENQGLYRGLLGLDRDDSAGNYPLTVRFAAENGSPDSLVSRLEVGEKDFGVTRLTVPGGTKKPDEKLLARIRRERALVDSVLSSRSREKLWLEPFTAPLERLTVTGDFGTKRIINGTGASPHGGLDLRAELGMPIMASNDGVVALCAEHYYAGRSIFLDHGLGVYSMYFHCEKILVGEGERVERGQVIATVGASGRATGPHLHWALTVGRARVDPMSVLALPLRVEELEEARTP